MPKPPPFEVRIVLDGWELFWARLETTGGGGDELARLRESVPAALRDSLDRDQLATHPPVAALRRLFKQAGCDPSRYRPSSEALLRRLLRGDELPAIHPLVDLNNSLSARLACPCCVMAEGTFEPPFTFRAGGEAESYVSLKGEFGLAGKPLLVDSIGPCDAPITGSERVKVTSSTVAATLVAYLPNGVVTGDDAERELRALVDAAPVARVLDVFSSRRSEP